MESSVLPSGITAKKTPRKIILATLQQISSNGISSLTTQQISKQAKVSTGLIHHYFATKENLLYSAFVYLIDDISNRVKTITSSPSNTPIENLRRLLFLNFEDFQGSQEAGNVWLQFWTHAQYDTRTKRLYIVFNRRFRSNLAYTLQLLSPNNRCSNISQATLLMAGLHGIWLEYQHSSLVRSREEALGLLDQLISNTTDYS